MCIRRRRLAKYPSGLQVIITEAGDLRGVTGKVAVSHFGPGLSDEPVKVQVQGKGVVSIAPSQLVIVPDQNFWAPAPAR